MHKQGFQIVRTAARVHANHAGLELFKKLKFLGSWQMTVHDRSATFIDAIDLDHVLG